MLSPQQSEVFKLVAEGHNGKGIAQILGIAPQTVAVHKHHLCRKLNVTSDIELYKRAVELGVVPAPIRSVP